MFSLYLNRFLLRIASSETEPWGDQSIAELFDSSQTAQAESSNH